MVTAGVTMQKVPKPHLQPAPLKKLVATGPPTQTVAIYGEVANANAKARFLSADVSAMNMDRLKFNPL